MTIDLEELRRLEAAATPGPWTTKEGETPCASPGDGIMADGLVVATVWDDDGLGGSTDCKPDVALIAAMRSALPELLDELEMLRAEPLVFRLPPCACGHPVKRHQEWAAKCGPQDCLDCQCFRYRPIAIPDWMRKALEQDQGDAPENG